MRHDPTRFAFAALVALALLGAARPATAQNTSVIGSVHNLSATGPGTIRAASEQQVCIFCHTPHHASQVYPLWNRNVPPSIYRPYASTSLDALPGQPTGSSKLCLSCHDGTIALGSVVSRKTPIGMAGGVTTIPPGKSNLGTNLTDDHPISFRYDSDLRGKDPKLKDPGQLPPAVRLDANSELQCTTCHDAHDNSRGNFLVMDNSSSQLCSACHNPGVTTVANHRNCSSCHQPHSAPSGPHLLTRAKASDACLACHNGGTGVQGPNVLADLRKYSVHDMSAPVDKPNHAPAEATCTDCHEAHTMATGSVAAAPNIPGNFGKAAGVNLAGAAVSPAKYEYEVCFRCHGDRTLSEPRVARQIVQNNTRLEFSPSAISFHPVAAQGRNNDVPSLKSPWTTGSMIYCNDCHSSDTARKAGGTGANGTHGSNNAPVLLRRYETRDNTTESESAYALCYTCHDRSRVLSESGPFRYHKKHIVEERTPCSVCHDAHGISSTQGSTTRNSHLINFDISVVQPDTNGRRMFVDQGSRRGQCYLRCHGENHGPESY